MEVSSELLFFFSGLGAFNGLLLAFYFIFWAKPKSDSNVFLGMFLLMLSVRVAKSIFYFFIPDISYSFLQVGLTACFFIGPFLYFHFASVTRDPSKPELRWRLHLYILTPIILFVNIIFPFESNLELWDPYVLKGIYVVWLSYTLMAFYQIRDVVQRILNREDRINKFEFWLLSIWFGNTMILFTYFFCGIGSYIVGALLFSFLYYLLIILLVYRFQKTPYNIVAKQKYGNKKIENAETLISQLNDLMQGEKLYRNPLLKLSSLAAKLKINPHTLSQLLNENMQKGFSQYLNEYRIKEACDIILTQDDLNYESIGYDVGYNAKSTFYKAFSKITGTTPAKFKESHAA